MDKEFIKPKILIVDDIPENLFALEKILAKLENAQIISASSGNEALTHILEHDFALIILDVQMPDMDGYEVAEILKSNENTESIPIIFVTAIDRDDAKEIKGYGSGAVDFIFKPFNKFILLSKVNVFLELHRIKNGLEQIVDQRTAELRAANQELKEEIEKNIEAAKEIERGRAYLLKVINSIPTSLITVDSQGKITDMNSHAQMLAEEGYYSNDITGRAVAELFPFYRFLDQSVQKALESGDTVEKNRTPVYIKGKLVINNFSIYPFSFDEKRGAIIRIDDVTEKVRTDEILIQSEKMLSMGGIAAGMAHEINNPLAGIIQNIQVIRNRLYGDLPANYAAADECGIKIDIVQNYLEKRQIPRMIESIYQSGMRAAQIVDEMLSFSRKNDGMFNSENLAELMDKSLKLALIDYKTKSDKDIGDIEIIKNYQSDMPLISCQPAKIQQVFLNVLKNSFQAFENKQNQEPKQLAITIKAAKNNMASIEISDNGEGMSEDVRKKIFQPFFTTKKNGTGLGLSISYFIITEDHKGELSVSSTLGRGSVFTIRLPLPNA